MKLLLSVTDRDLEHSACQAAKNPVLEINELLCYIITNDKVSEG
jgi:hypothetical protein